MENKSVQASVYTALKNSIMRLQLKPGTVVSTQEIATMLGVSRTPVREAFIRLQRDGLVDIYPQKETVVSRISLKRMQQERFIRESLECANIDAIIHKGGPYDYSALMDNLELQKRLLKREKFDSFEFMQVDNEFHRQLFILGGQELSWDVISDTSTHYTRIRLVTLGNMEIVKASVLEHETILSEVASCYSELARGHIRSHLHRLETEIDDFMKTYPDYFDTKEERIMDRADTLIAL